jgi:hypothetical protein
MADTDALMELLTAHQRMDAPGTCSCGHVTPLGRLVTEHVAKVIMAAGWRKAGTS